MATEAESLEHRGLLSGCTSAGVRGSPGVGTPPGQPVALCTCVFGDIFTPGGESGTGAPSPSPEQELLELLELDGSRGLASGTRELVWVQPDELRGERPPRGCVPPSEMRWGSQERAPWREGAPEGQGPAGKGLFKASFDKMRLLPFEPTFLGLTQNGT